MNRCKTCRWWEKFSHNCYGWCVHEKLQEDYKELDGAMGSVEHEHSVATGAEFGCIHHEEKTQ